MRIFLTQQAQKQLKKLSDKIKKKFDKKIDILIKNKNHPSLYFRKKANSDQYEGRIDIHYRFSGEFIGEDFYITAIGSHDAGLGKK